MTPERWQQIDSLLQAALDREPADRQDFLDRQCRADPELRAEVGALLDSEAHVHQFLDASALEDSLSLLHDDPEIDDAGLQIGSYVLERRLGSGGMGDVMLAEDSRLGRKVALKLLDPALTSDRVGRARFLREARLASSLDHVNVCTVYEVGEADGRLFIAMQHVHGQTLRQACENGPLPSRELLAIAVQVADALAAAHARGIVHRDVKSGNIMVTPQGGVKVLDFGLAILLEQEPGQGTEVTASGDVIGTPASMSPEQARGERVDHHSDIFSFGVVLYEMATGCPPFTGASRADVVSAVLGRRPEPPASITPGVPDRLSRAIERALAKRPADRYQSMQELADHLQAIAAEQHHLTEPPLASGPPAGAGVHAPRGRARWRGWPSTVRHPFAGIAATLVVVVGLAFLVAWLWRGREPHTPAHPPVRSLAVLPFKPVVERQRDEALELGMADMLITRLGAFAGIEVRPIGAVRQFSRLDQDPRAAGRAQLVDAVIDGNIQRSGEQIRVTVRMTRVADGRQLWAEQFDERFTNVFALQDSIAARVSGALAVTLTTDAPAGSPTGHSANVEAYQSYLLGRYHLTRLSDEGFTKALEYFRRATRQDPTYALAHAGVARAYLDLSSFNAMSSREGFPKARAAAEAALALDERLADAHMARAGAIFLHDWNWSAADAEYRRALALGPGVADAHLAYGMFLASMGRADEALRESIRALELDPVSPATIAGVGYVLQLARRPGEAEERYRAALDLDPDFGYGRWCLGRVLSEQQRHAEAAIELQKAVTLSGGSPDEIAELARAQAAAGQTTAARAMLARLHALSRTRYTSPTTIASVYASLGDRQNAFAWLDRAYGERDFLLVTVRVEPMFDPLRGDRRFTDLLTRMGLLP